MTLGQPPYYFDPASGPSCPASSDLELSLAAAAPGTSNNTALTGSQVVQFAHTFANPVNIAAGDGNIHVYADEGAGISGTKTLEVSLYHLDGSCQILATLVDSAEITVATLAEFVIPFSHSAIAIAAGETIAVVITKTGTWNELRVYHGGANDSRVEFAVVEAPAAPTNLTAQPSSFAPAHVVDLEWDAPDDGGSPITGYLIERKVGAGSFATLIADTESTDTTHEDRNLDPETTYTYRVSAINAVGTSDPSNEASATTEALRQLNACPPFPRTTSRTRPVRQATPDQPGGGVLAGERARRIVRRTYTLDLDDLTPDEFNDLLGVWSGGLGAVVPFNYTLPGEAEPRRWLFADDTMRRVHTSANTRGARITLIEIV